MFRSLPAHRISRAAARLLVACALALSAAPPTRAEHGDDHAEHHEMMHEHSGHGSDYSRAVRKLRVPDLSLRAADGSDVPLRAALESDDLLLLNFIFTSCTTICPVMTATFAAARKQLDAQGESYRMISISIDPEHDTPERLAAYARRHHAGAEWRFLTGDSASITTLQRAFGIYRGNKMNHVPVSFLRGGGGDRWLRLDGFPSASQLVHEARRLAVK